MTGEESSPMSTTLNPEPFAAAPEPLELVPRMKGQGYAAEHVARRRAWVEAKTGGTLRQVGACSIPSEGMRGNVENPVGAAQVPLSVAGPLVVRGLNARGS